MKIENSELEAFVAVAELGTFHRAAEKLNLTQPGLSRRIQKLEQTLGVELFQRTTRSVTLTGVGRQFLPMAREQIAQLGMMLSSIQDIAQKRYGKVRLASIPTIVAQALPDVLRRYAAKYPHVAVQILDGNHDFVLSQVRAGIAEFGVSLHPGDDDDLLFEPLFTDRYVLAAHNDDPLARADAVTLGELRQAKLIIGGRDSGNRLLLEMLMGQEAVRTRWFYEVEHISCVAALVAAGVGCAILPESALRAYGSPAVRAVPIASPTIERTVGIVRHRGISMSSFAGDLQALVKASFA
ncbi:MULTISPECIES: LysR family transcriptional regulator [Burkholderia cepacia complex]|uniref:LysR family transcriptional regulator n=1 Tax=Burkholderia cepacia complex TaxID=87882 RepID=UPI00098103C6|nr:MULTISPECIES: LysR family transcriptional regulator [Burkholderia cepacia complex]AQQ34289.1 LysR family transcriptional regulator [Burkholderia cenocepacia]AQT53397.1 LysR family transcriptional regulator [Burkholderia cenocepacia]MBJ9728533.1 LysR family transcriptional regulator [Burkholderia cenocepacia]MBK1818590.1 LysR family transcriptional regulator [Burkholderia orbicola]MBR8080345.1 LysR family transcriptional regulator [Burkholderia cenocepacia]